LILILDLSRIFFAFASGLTPKARMMIFSLLFAVLTSLSETLPIPSLTIFQGR
jgi:hypothetical protein